MKGKSIFTDREIDELKRLINIKNSLPSDKQKVVRDQMRAMHFYITDFTSKKGFEVSDLQELIERGIIKKVESTNSSEKGNGAGIAQIKANHQHHSAPTNVTLFSFDQTFLEKYNFIQHITYQEFKVNPSAIRKIPEAKGLYVVVSESPRKEFLSVGTGGHFKEKNPNVSIETLSEKWIDNTNIMYIGKAGGISENGTESNSTLRKRLNTYFNFGLGKPVGHWGGRFIWQLAYADDLIFYWRICDETENPVDLEHKLIEEYKNHYGKFPFANLTR